jgi:hypothetical protein
MIITTAAPIIPNFPQDSDDANRCDIIDPVRDCCNYFIENVC